ncbi:MAG: type II toxin-antitoxin system PemK/MazF family toxin [SAR202 cluster bacterium]|nr:type II toxin-antitoxin system PemK/MazF family toxin [SAR202 cluster bacterium]
MKQGEIWWADLGPPAGTRPVLLLSRNKVYISRDSVTVALVTTRMRGLPSEIPLSSKDGMPRDCVINIDVIDTVPKQYLTRRITAINDEKTAAVEKAIHYVFGLSW